MHHPSKIRLLEPSALPEPLLERLRADVRFEGIAGTTTPAPSRDVEAWAVFGDHLLEQGDVRGAMIQERLAAEA
ncbi:MAG: hypothetical protein AAF602_32550, partial [Myxococcota bacterium]